MSRIEKIFLVDDEEIINAIQARIVKTEFPETEIIKFNTAKELLEYLKQIKFKPLIFLDLNMPQMDAIDFLEELDTLNLSIEPIIFVLTYSRNLKEIEIVKKFTTVRDVIFKPINSQKINLVKKSLPFLK